MNYVSDAINWGAPLIFVLIALSQVLRLVHAWLLHRTLRQAMAGNAAITGPLVDKLAKVERQGELPGDDRNGLVLVAIGVALGGFALIQQDDYMRTTLGASLFPLLVGIALLARYALVKRAMASAAGAEATGG